MNPTFYLLCSERSGSNLMRVILGAHTAISAPPPPHLLDKFIPRLPLYGDLAVDAHRARLAEDMADVLNHGIEPWNWNANSGELLAHAGAPTFWGLFHAAYALEARARGKDFSFVKDNGALRHAFPVLAAPHPKKFVYLVRDPRDVAASWLKSKAHTGGVGEAARIWASEQEQALRVLALARKYECHCLHYEDLVSDPESQLRALCAFLGIDFEAAMLSFHSTEEARRSAGRVADWENLARPMLHDNFGKYRRQLSPRQIRTVETIARRPMQLLGYPFDFEARRRSWWADVPRVLRGAPALAALAVSGKEGRAEFRLRLARLKKLRAVEQRAEMSPVPWSRPAHVIPAADTSRPETPEEHP